MASRVTGGGAEAIASKLDYLRGGGFRSDSAEVIAAAALKLVQDGFNDSKDPYLVPWKAVYRRGKRGGPGKPLMKTGRLYRSATAGRNGAGNVEVAITAEYAGYQQGGTKARPVASRQLRQNARGRFVKNSAKTAFLSRSRPHVNVGITARAMIPDERGMPPRWERRFDDSVERLLDRKLGARS